MRKNFARVAAAAALSAGLTLGLASPALAQSPGLPSLGSPGLPSPGLNSPGLTLPKSTAEKKKLGYIGGPAWSADIYFQVIRGAEVRPGGYVTVRVEAVGVNGEGRLREIGHVIPAGFELVSVTRQSSDNIFGKGIYTLKEDEYTNNVNDRGNREVRLNWTEGGFLGLFKDNPTVSTSKSVAVDFTYKAPAREAEYDHGGIAYLGAVINPSGYWPTGGQAIKVSKSASWWPF